jgi:hypothetical protein
MRQPYVTSDRTLPSAPRGSAVGAAFYSRRSLASAKLGAMVRTGGGGPGIDSPEQAIVAVLILLVVAAVWWWRSSD